MADLVETLSVDLMAESERLHGVLEHLDEAGWNTPTGCVPWTIKDQASHIAWNDEAAVRALEDPDAFRADKPTTPEGVQRMVDKVITDHHDLPGAELLAWLRRARSALLDASAGRDPRMRMPWYGPDMSLASKLTARFMESWAHGYDVYDALGVTMEPTDRVRHVVFLGLQAIPNSYIANGLEPPSEPVRLELTSPSGETWAMGKPEAIDVVRGPAFDLARVVTQRTHIGDTDLTAVGPVATEWLGIAQAFAGPPGTGRTAAGS